MKKNILSLVLALSMLTAFAPIMTSAETGIEIGEYLQMGTYYGEPILWRCVDRDENGSLILADKIICIRAFDAKTDVNDATGSHSRQDGGEDDEQFWIRQSWGSNYWADSNMRSWLNSTASAGNIEWLCGNPPDKAHLNQGYNEYAQEAGFLSNFTQSERNAMKEVRQKSLLSYPETDANMETTGTEYHSYDAHISDVVQNYDTAYAEYVTDKMFCLDIKQVNAVYNNSNILGKNYYIAEPTAQCVEHSKRDTIFLYVGKTWSYWLRSPSSTNSVEARYVEWYPGGHIYAQYANYDDHGVRPAFYLSDDIQFIDGNGTENNPYKFVSGNSENTKSTPNPDMADTTPDTYEVGEITPTDTGISFTVTTKEAVSGKQAVIVACYDEKGVFTGLKQQEITAADTAQDISVEIDKTNIKTVKTFIWNGLEYMMPASNIQSLEL